MGNVCVLADCAGDRFDKGDEALLERRTYNDLVLCDETTDEFILNQAAGEALRLTIRYDNGVGHLNLAVTSQNGDDSPIGASETRYGAEVIEIGPSVQDRSLSVTVSGYAGYDVSYDLTVETLPVGACIADRYEGIAGNDVLARATMIDPGSYDHSICADQDWFAVELVAGLDLSVSAYPGGRVDAVDLGLYDGAGQPLAAGVFDPDGNGDVTLSYEVQSTATYYMLVERNDPTVPANTNRLEVSVEPSANAAQFACGEAVPINLGDIQPLASLDSAANVIRAPVSCGLGTGRTVVATINLAAPTRVSVSVSQSDRGLISAALSVRSPLCTDQDDELYCGLAGQGVGAGQVMTFCGGGADEECRGIDFPAGQSFLVFELNGVGPVSFSATVDD